jgi:predicted transcriptional regulator
MKRIAWIILLLSFYAPLVAEAASLQVGAKAPDFNLKDIAGRSFSLNSPLWKGKVLLFVAMPITEAKTNAAVSETIAKEGGVDRTKLGGAAIFAAPSEDALKILKARQKETGKIYLIDSNESVTKFWGLKKGASNVILLDKGRVCLFLFSGKLPGPEIARLVEVIKKYQAR